MTATTRAEEPYKDTPGKGSLSHPLPRGKDASLLDKREPSRKAKGGALMIQARKRNGGIAPASATSPTPAVLVHSLSICPVPITSQNGPVPAQLKDGTAGIKVWGTVSPV